VKTSSPLVPLLLPNISGVQQKDTKPNQINKNTEKSSSTIYLTLAGRNPLRRRWEASSTQLSLGLSRSLSLALCSSARALHRRVFKALSSTRDKQAPVLLPFCP
jgi:hypothetical protein